jgi:hypothetical protein
MRSRMTAHSSMSIARARAARSACR